MRILTEKVTAADELIIKGTQIMDGIMRILPTEEQERITTSYNEDLGCELAFSVNSHSVQQLNSNNKKVKVQYSVTSYDTIYTITVYEDGTRGITEESTEKTS